MTLAIPHIGQTVLYNTRDGILRPAVVDRVHSGQVVDLWVFGEREMYQQGHVARSPYFGEVGHPVNSWHVAGEAPPAEAADDQSGGQRVGEAGAL
jgi:hypothetical protein